MSARQLPAALLALLAGVAAVVAVAAWYVRGEVIDREAFAGRAVRALERDEVRTAVRAELTAEVLAQVPAAELLGDRVERTVGSAIDAPPFRRAFRQGAAEVNRVLFERGGDDASLRVDVGAILGGADPRLGELLPAGLETRLVSLRAERLGVGTRRAADLTDALAILAPAIAVLALALALLIAADRRAVLRWAAVAVVLTAAVLLALLAFGRGGALDELQAGGSLTRQQTRDAAEAALAVYTDDLRTRLLIAIAAGVALLLLTLLPRRRPAGG